MTLTVGSRTLYTAHGVKEYFTFSILVSLVCLVAARTLVFPVVAVRCFSQACPL